MDVPQIQKRKYMRQLKQKATKNPKGHPNSKSDSFASTCIGAAAATGHTDVSHL